MLNKFYKPISFLHQIIRMCVKMYWIYKFDGIYILCFVFLNFRSLCNFIRRYYLTSRYMLCFVSALSTGMIFTYSIILFRQCIGYAALFYCGFPLAFHINILLFPLLKLELRAVSLLFTSSASLH